MKTWILLFLGGGTGTLMRYAIQLMLKTQPASLFPWSTLAANLLGSFLIGMFYTLSARLGMNGDMRLMLTTGLCGGFTTFSTFSHESLALFRQGEYALCIIYISACVILGMAFVWLGSMAAKYTFH